MSVALETIIRLKTELLTSLHHWTPQDASGDIAEQFRIHFLSPKGVLKSSFEHLKSLEKEEKKEGGLLLNEIKVALEEKYQSLLEEKKSDSSSQQATKEDVTLPGISFAMGNRHPIYQTMDDIIQIFATLGYVVKEANEIEDDWHNFTALNMPEWHPARDMQDTFYIADHPHFLLRTHTSNVQVRSMLNSKPPIRMIAPGRVYRNETISARSHCFFHQVEGMYIDKKVSFADLKNSLYAFVRAFFGEHTKVRFRPSYFPFTTPSAEMDISCFFCEQKGCNICKYSGWVEILGCGMMHPHLFESCGIDPHQYQGFAFGMGIERLTMLKYQITDIRKFSENEMSFLSQFKPF